MEEWWMSMDGFMQTLWGIAVFASIVFIGQMIMTFVGMDSDISTDVDFNGDTSGGGEPFQLFTFRNFVNFFLGFGWTAIALRPAIDNTFLLLLSAVLVGVLLVAAVLLIFRWMSGMEQSGNITMDQAVGCTGEVYLPIPAARKGEGKVQISIHEAIREYDALTEGEALATGTPIRVVKVINSLVIVEHI